MIRILCLFLVFRFLTHALPELGGQGLGELIEEPFNTLWYQIEKLWK